MKRLNQLERRSFLLLPAYGFEMQRDWPRRLRNALIALAAEDPQWMMWCEQEVDPHWPLPQQVRLVEARARILVLRHYRFLGRERIGDLVFRDTWVFTDSGSLSPG